MKKGSWVKAAVASAALCLGVIGAGQVSGCNSVSADDVENGQVNKFDKYKGYQGLRVYDPKQEWTQGLSFESGRYFARDLRS